MRIFLLASLLLMACSERVAQDSSIQPIVAVATPKVKTYPYYIDSPEGPCPANSLMSNTLFDVVSGDIHPRVEPSTKADKVVNEKATSVIGKTQFVDMGAMTGVTEVCRYQEWSYVQANSPDYLTQSHKGWVLSKNIKPEIVSDGLKQFPESAFYFGKSEKPHKEIIMKGVHMVQKDNPRCQGSIDPSSAALSPSKGSAKDPVFFVTCGSGIEAFNVWFSKSDVLNNKEVKALAHLPKSEAVSRCERWVKTKANHPSTVNFSRFLDLTIEESANGSTRVTSTFKAQNSFGLELEHEVSCLVNAEGLMEGAIKELGT